MYIGLFKIHQTVKVQITLHLGITFLISFPTPKSLKKINKFRNVFFNAVKLIDKQQNNSAEDEKKF